MKNHMRGVVGHKSMFCVAGDFLGGSALAVRTQGQALVAILNEMQVDCVCLGNHEFDYAAEVIDTTF